jgi:hypothetical protein
MTNDPRYPFEVPPPRRRRWPYPMFWVDLGIVVLAVIIGCAIIGGWGR